MTTHPSDILVFESEAVSPLLMVQGNDESHEGKGTTADCWEDKDVENEENSWSTGDENRCLLMEVIHSFTSTISEQESKTDSAGKDENPKRSRNFWLSAVVLSLLALVLTTTASLVNFVNGSFGVGGPINPWFEPFRSYEHQGFIWSLVRFLVSIANILGALLWISLLRQFVVTNEDGDTVWVNFRIKAPPSRFCFGAAAHMCVCIAFYLTSFLIPLFMEGASLRTGFWLMLLGILLWAWATQCLLRCARSPIAIRAFVSHLRAFEWPQSDENEHCT